VSAHLPTLAHADDPVERAAIRAADGLPAEILDYPEQSWAPTGDPLGVFSRWGALRRGNYPSVSKAESAGILAGLGGHPVVLFGVRPDGSCSCGSDHAGRANSIGKHPRHRGWQTAALDLDSIAKDLRRDPYANLGWRMGPQPGGFRLIAIDCDGPLSLLDEIGTFPATLTARTGRGWHLVYRWPAGKDLPKNQASLIAGHVDLRSVGGQIVVAPSVHRSGHRYEWWDCREPAELKW
jgi:hypothetical protein